MGLREESVPVRMQRFAKFFAATYRNWDWSDAPPNALKLFAAFPGVPLPKENTPVFDPPTITLSPQSGFPWYECVDYEVDSREVLYWIEKKPRTWDDHKSLLWIAQKWSAWVKSNSEEKLNRSTAGKASGVARRKMSKSGGNSLFQ
jgi:hypothetical protein